MKWIITIVCLLLNSFTFSQSKLGGIGQWRAHFDNHSIQQIVRGDLIYAASPFQLIGIDDSLNNHWFDKTNGLSDIEIRQLAWDPLNSQLIIAYANSNIDIKKGDQIFNINAIQLTNLYPDHKINSIQVFNNWGLISTNFGIVVIDLQKHEIKDTWYPNNNQQATITFDIAIAHDSIYASTENGIFACPLQNKWIVSNKWNKLSNIVSTAMLVQHNNVYAYNAHALYQIPFSAPILQFANASLQKLDSTESGIGMSIKYPSNKGAFIRLNKDLTQTTLIDSSQLISPMQSVTNQGKYWIADSSQGLLLKNQQTQWLNLGGPKSQILGDIYINETNLVAPYGNLANGFAVFSENNWKQINQIGNVIVPSLNAAIISKKEEDFWFTSASGLVHSSNNNSQIEWIRPNQNTGSYKFIQEDQNNLIWTLQDQQGIVRQTNNSWNSIPIPNNFISNGLNKFTLNEQGQAWIIAPNQQGIYIYQSKDVFASEIWRQITTQSSNGNLPSMHVLSICKDKTGSIWVGTDNGIGIFNCGDIASSPCNAYLPIVSNNGFNGYLFQHEMVNCIVADGANRKWIGTNNGAWLLSEDGLTIIEHFTKSNSPLPSDSILQIAIAPTTGEVFINTSKQLVSYRGTATEGQKSQATIQIFPNPIPPSFNGTVAIRGLINNAIVKITDLTGKLLYQTQALGGQAIWNGRTYEGKKLAAGIYFVFVRDLSGNENSVGKIVVADGY